MAGGVMRALILVALIACGRGPSCPRPSAVGTSGTAVGADRTCEVRR